MTDITLTVNRNFDNKLQGSARKRVKLTISQNIGTAPNVLFYDPIEVQDGWLFRRTTPLIGNDWDVAPIAYKYVKYANRNWVPFRDPDNVGSSSSLRNNVAFDVGSTLNNFFVCYRMTSMHDKIFPFASGANQPMDFASNLSAKHLWLTDPNNIGTPDQVLPTFNQNGMSAFGNTTTPKAYTPATFSIHSPTDLGYDYFDTSGSSTLFGYYQSGDQSNSTAHDAVLKYIRVDQFTSKIDTYLGNPYEKDGVNFAGQRYYDGYIAVNAQCDTPATGFPNVQHGQADYYVAEGANCLASVWASNAATWADQTLAYVVPPQTWTAGATSEVICNPLPRERLGYYHFMMGDGSIINNVPWVEI